METKTFNPVDYENALWGKDIYTLRGLEVRADILSDVFPEISKEIEKLLKKINEYREHYPIKMQINILYLNQRLFANWVEEVFNIYKQVVSVLKTIHTYESHTWEVRKLQDRDIIAVALFGAYKNRTDTDLYDNIDNIFFAAVDIELGFNMEESAYGVIADYILENITKYKDTDKKVLLEKLQTFAPKYIIESKPDAFFGLLTDLAVNK